jgi:hypothetical protein
MIGLLYIGFFGVYLLLSGWLTDWAARRAKKRGIAGWKWGLPMALVMYHLVFWDWVPTVVAHQYYCSKYGGFTVYKTLKEWKMENPSVEETLTWKDLSDSEQINGKSTYFLNQRFSWVSDWEDLPLSMAVKIERIIDRKTNEVMAEKKDIPAGVRAIGLGARSIRDYKFWFEPYKTCFKESERVTKWLFEEKSFGQLITEFKEIGRKKDEQ